MTAALAAAGLHAGYGEVRVLQGVTLSVAAGSITAVIGANGAGKTTLMRVLAGLVAPTAGTLSHGGAAIGALPAHARVARGIVLVPEGRMVFPDMTVRENLVLGAVNARARPLRDATMAQVFALFPRLAEREGQLAGTLSGGEQQMLALGRGLMAQPKVLLLDEPTLGLAPGIARMIFRIVPQLRDLGITVVIAEQDLRRTLRIADHAYVLENGIVAAEGAGRDLEADPAVRRAYLGHG
jgi:branched-chain amino acid transport system ATP-binding protein